LENICDLLKSNLDILTTCLGNNLQFSQENENCCLISTDKLEVRIYCDDRNGVVSSTVSFCEAKQPISEPLDTHTIASVFGESTYQSAGNNLTERVRTECDNICRVLTLSNEQGVSPGELYYYYRGHNEGYTKAVSI
jgi:hypothetical protein